MTDILIVGHGPAGVSAALYTVRAGLSTLMIGKDYGALGKTDSIENYYGFTASVPGTQLAESGIAQAKRLGAEVIGGEVVGIQWDNHFTVETTESVYEANAVILATGATHSAPDVKGLNVFEGRGISYCAVCDAFFYRGKDVAVLGDGAYALHEALELQPVVNSVTVLTNGEVPSVVFPSNMRVITAKLSELSGSTVLEQAVFENSETLALSGLFVAVGVAGSTELAKKVGAVVEGNRIVTDAAMLTSVPGLWAAGDCTGGMRQIAKAVYEGAVAGTEAVKYWRKLKQ